MGENGSNGFVPSDEFIYSILEDVAKKEMIEIGLLKDRINPRIDEMRKKLGTYIYGCMDSLARTVSELGTSRDNVQIIHDGSLTDEMISGLVEPLLKTINFRCSFRDISKETYNALAKDIYNWVGDHSGLNGFRYKRDDHRNVYLDIRRGEKIKIEELLEAH